jgi:hypothetical protein
MVFDLTVGRSIIKGFVKKLVQNVQKLIGGTFIDELQ